MKKFFAKMTPMKKALAVAAGIAALTALGIGLVWAAPPPISGDQAPPAGHFQSNCSGCHQITQPAQAPTPNPTPPSVTNPDSTDQSPSVGESYEDDGLRRDGYRDDADDSYEDDTDDDHAYEGHDSDDSFESRDDDEYEHRTSVTSNGRVDSDSSSDHDSDDSLEKAVHDDDHGVGHDDEHEGFEED